MKVVERNLFITHGSAKDVGSCDFCTSKAKVTVLRGGVDGYESRLCDECLFIVTTGSARPRTKKTDPPISAAAVIVMEWWKRRKPLRKGDAERKALLALDKVHKEGVEWPVIGQMLRYVLDHWPPGSFHTPAKLMTKSQSNPGLYQYEVIQGQMDAPKKKDGFDDLMSNLSG